MSGGQRIDDHSFWAGAKSEGSVFPAEKKVKKYMSAEGAGAENDYEDTSEAVKRAQDASVDKAKARPMKPGYRY